MAMTSADVSMLSELLACIAEGTRAELARAEADRVKMLRDAMGYVEGKGPRDFGCLIEELSTVLDDDDTRGEFQRVEAALAAAAQDEEWPDGLESQDAAYQVGWLVKEWRASRGKAAAS